MGSSTSIDEDMINIRIEDYVYKGRGNQMNVITKVSDLSIREFRALIRKTMLDTLNEFSLREIDTEEQAELEAMFGTDPGSEKAVYQREIQL